MKKLILLFAISATTIFTSCSSDDSIVAEYPQNGSNPQLDVPGKVQMKYSSNDPLDQGPMSPHRHQYSFLYLLDIDNLSPEYNPITNVKIELIHSAGRYDLYNGIAQKCNIITVPAPYSLQNLKYKIILTYQDGSIEKIEHLQSEFYSSFQNFECLQ